MGRLDISPYLIHFTSGETLEVAFRNLQAIITSGQLVASGNKIRGGYRCVCFSEAPLSSLASGLVNESYYSRYSPFGVMVSKKWLFTQGGRPVIYQTEEEYLRLPEELRWRHVRYDIRKDGDEIDFTWEREWRIQAEALVLDSSEADLIVLDAAWAQRLISEHDRRQDYRVLQYTTILAEDLAELYREPFSWRVLTLR